MFLCGNHLGMTCYKNILLSLQHWSVRLLRSLVLSFTATITIISLLTEFLLTLNLVYIIEIKLITLKSLTALKHHGCDIMVTTPVQYFQKHRRCDIMVISKTVSLLPVPTLGMELLVLRLVV